jgi:hypothetical protein
MSTILSISRLFLGFLCLLGSPVISTIQAETRPTPATPSVPKGEALKKLLVGKWRLSIEEGNLKVEGLSDYKSDGTTKYTVTTEYRGEKSIVEIHAKWRIEGTKLITVVTKTSDSEVTKVGDESTYEVLHIDTQSIKYRDDEGKVAEESRITGK